MQFKIFYGIDVQLINCTNKLYKLYTRYTLYAQGCV